MSDFREEEALGKAYDSQLMRRLMTYLRPYKWRVVFAVFLTLLVGPLEVVGPYLFGYGVDKFIIPGSNYSLAASAALRGVALVSLGFLAALLLSFAVQYLQVRIMQDVGQLTLYDLRRDIFERLQRLPMSFYDRSPVGRLVTRVTTDVDALNDLFAAGIAAMANDAIVLLCIGAVMMKMNWRLALATFAVLLVPAGTHQRHERGADFQS
jgi:ATP-binding cassette subfamily B protein